MRGQDELREPQVSIPGSGDNGRNSNQPNVDTRRDAYLASRTIAVVIVLIFLISVACRIPFLMRPSTGQHDEITLQSMLIMKVWDQTGLWKTHFLPAENYANPADRFIATRPLVDSDGISYYVSFPPGAFLLAFGAHRLMPDMDLRLVLKGLNLLALLLASFALAALLEKALGPGKQGFVLAAIGVFLFNRAVLMSLGNLYNAV